MITICPACSNSLKSKNLKGSSFPWGKFPNVQLCVDFYAMSCVNCEEFVLRSTDIIRFDEALEASIVIE